MKRKNIFDDFDSGSESDEEGPKEDYIRDIKKRKIQPNPKSKVVEKKFIPQLLTDDSHEYQVLSSSFDYLDTFKQFEYEFQESEKEKKKEKEEKGKKKKGNTNKRKKKQVKSRFGPPPKKFTKRKNEQEGEIKEAPRKFKTRFGPPVKKKEKKNIIGPVNYTSSGVFGGGGDALDKIKKEYEESFVYSSTKRFDQSTKIEVFPPKCETEKQI